MVWQKPRGRTIAQIICLGGGGGGGGGFSGAATTNRGGGGSGGSSGIARLTLPIALLPNTLFIQVGAGGVGGAAGTTGGNGIISFVAIAPNTTVTNLVATSDQSNAGQGGGGGSGSGAGAGGSAGNLPRIQDAPLAGLGQHEFLIGIIGVSGGVQTGANGGAIAIPTTGQIVMAGSGGAGVTTTEFAGGAFTAITDSWLSQQRPATPAVGSNNGSGGPQLWTPFFNFGGGGGSSSNAGAGGMGGNAAHGSGGGGGGGGNPGGVGGNGGDGIVIITAW
jgi:hypothetical protein